MSFFSVKIANLSLSHIGQGAHISDPSELSTEAEHCRRFYPIALAEMLEAHDWSFARARATLAQLDSDLPDFAYRYALPADCVMPRRLLPEGFADSQQDAVEFTREGSYIYSNTANATLVYTRHVKNPTTFSAEFVAGMSYLLGSYLAGPIVKDATGRTQERLRQAAMRSFSSGAATNSDRSRAVHRSTAQRSR